MEKEEVVETIKRVMEWAKETYNFPKETPHCYNCIHDKLCKKRGYKDGADVDKKRLLGLIKARTCPHYSFDSENNQTLQFDKKKVNEEDLEVFFEVVKKVHDLEKYQTGKTRIIPNKEEILAFFDSFENWKKMAMPWKKLCVCDCIHEEVCYKKKDYKKGEGCFPYKKKELS